MTTDSPKAAVASYENALPVANVTVDGKILKYAIPNSMCLWRVQTLTTKEPDTMTWLNSIPRGATLLDVGANVGLYSVYAACIRDAQVFAFEPESQNYATLNKNINLNNLDGRVIAWCAALSDEQKFDKLYLSGFKQGGSCHTFGESVDPNLNYREFPFQQGCFATTLDQLVASGTMPVPNFIKIDVDGIEHKVIRGAEHTLRNAAVSSLIIEVNSNLDEHNWIVTFLNSLGFNHDPDQFARAQRSEGFFKGTGEYVFRR
jgi:FkbM family methyltransferase